MSESKFVVIDGNEVPFHSGETILQAARQAEIEIPTLCLARSMPTVMPPAARRTASPAAVSHSIVRPKRG